MVSQRKVDDYGLRKVMMGEKSVEKAVIGMRDVPGVWALGGW